MCRRCHMALPEATKSLFPPARGSIVPTAFDPFFSILGAVVARVPKRIGFCDKKSFGQRISSAGHVHSYSVIGGGHICLVKFVRLGISLKIELAALRYSCMGGWVLLPKWPLRDCSAGCVDLVVFSVRRCDQRFRRIPALDWDPIRRHHNFRVLGRLLYQPILFCRCSALSTRWLAAGRSGRTGAFAGSRRWSLVTLGSPLAAVGMPAGTRGSSGL